MKRERGFGLVETILGLALLASALALIVPFLLDLHKDRHAVIYADHIKTVISRVQQYHHFKVTEERVPSSDADSWPATLNHLMTDYPLRYWNECSTAQEANSECVKPDYVPWSRERITSRVDATAMTPPYYSHMVLTIPLSTLMMDTKEYLRWSVPLMTIPGAKKTPAQDIEITLRQATSALIYDGFVLRTGDKTLTDDWDVGDHVIGNAKDFTIRNSDGSVSSISEALVYVHSLKPWDSISKPSCPDGLRPELTLSLGALDITYPFTLVGSIKPYVSNETSTHWTVTIDAYVMNNQNNTYQRLNTGEIIAFTQCKR